jgi:putative transposase
VLDVDRTGLYRISSRQSARDELAVAELRAAHQLHRAYGYRRLVDELHWSPEKTRRIMKLAGVVPLGHKPKHPKTGPVTEEQVDPNVRRNVLKEENIMASYPHHVWAEDFTYLYFYGRWYYLATVIDLYSRQAVGWALGAHHDTLLIETALLDALSRFPAPTILHNDQGSEYCSKRYFILCESADIRLSFSKKASPWENGFQESFYREFKIELEANELNRFKDLGELTEAIARQLYYYNHHRLHSALKTNPVAYAKQYENAQELPASQPNRPNVLAWMLTETKIMAKSLRDRVLQKTGA